MSLKMIRWLLLMLAACVTLAGQTFEKAKMYVEQEHKLKLHKVAIDVQDEALVVTGKSGKYSSVVRPLRVVVLAPGRDLALGVRQVREPMRVQTFLAEPSVETFDESILHGFAGLDEVLPHLRFQRPRLHGPRLKLRSVGARGRPPGAQTPHATPSLRLAAA